MWSRIILLYHSIYYLLFNLFIFPWIFVFTFASAYCTNERTKGKPNSRSAVTAHKCDRKIGIFPWKTDALSTINSQLHYLDLNKENKFSKNLFTHFENKILIDFSHSIRVPCSMFAGFVGNLPSLWHIVSYQVWTP